MKIVMLQYEVLSYTMTAVKSCMLLCGTIYSWLYYTDSAGMSTSLLPPNSERVKIHLGGYNCAICHTQLILWEYEQTTTLKSQMNELGGTRDVITQMNELGDTKDVKTLMNELDVNSLTESVYWWISVRVEILPDQFNRVNLFIFLLFVSFPVTAPP